MPDGCRLVDYPESYLFILLADPFLLPESFFMHSQHIPILHLLWISFLRPYNFI